MRTRRRVHAAAVADGRERVIVGGGRICAAAHRVPAARAVVHPRARVKARGRRVHAPRERPPRLLLLPPRALAPDDGPQQEDAVAAVDLREGVVILGVGEEASPAARLPVTAAGEIYGALLNKVRANGYDNITRRAYTTTGEKLRDDPRVRRR